MDSSYAKEKQSETAEKPDFLDFFVEFFNFYSSFRAFWNCFKLQLSFKQGFFGARHESGGFSKKQICLGSLYMENSLSHIPALTPGLFSLPPILLFLNLILHRNRLYCAQDWPLLLPPWRLSSMVQGSEVGPPLWGNQVLKSQLSPQEKFSEKLNLGTLCLPQETCLPSLSNNSHWNIIALKTNAYIGYCSS